MIIYFKTRSKARQLAQSRKLAGLPGSASDTKHETSNGLRYAVNLKTSNDKPFPITLIGDINHAEEQANTIKRLTSRLR